MFWCERIATEIARFFSALSTDEDTASFPSSEAISAAAVLHDTARPHRTRSSTSAAKRVRVNDEDSEQEELPEPIPANVARQLRQPRKQKQTVTVQKGKFIFMQHAAD